MAKKFVGVIAGVDVVLEVHVVSRMTQTYKQQKQRINRRRKSRNLLQR